LSASPGPHLVIAVEQALKALDVILVEAPMTVSVTPDGWDLAQLLLELDPSPRGTEKRRRVADPHRAM